MALALAFELSGWVLIASMTAGVKDPPVGKSSPNVVLIIIDTLRADKLGCYRSPQAHISPEIDEMARHGVLFENAFSQCSWTRPSIGSLVTARYPRSIGIFKEKFDMLHKADLTLAEILRQNGYRTFGITANPNINRWFNFHQGFDEYRDTNVVWSWMAPASGHQPGVSDQDLPLPRCDQVFSEVLKQAAQFKKESPRHPAYFQIVIMEVHSPQLIRSEYVSAFDESSVRKLNYDYPRSKLVNLVRGTRGAVRQVSHDIGAFVLALRQMEGYADTLFVITSDHGQGLDDHPDVWGSAEHGNLLYESHIRVPLIFYHPTVSGPRYHGSPDPPVGTPSGCHAHSPGLCQNSFAPKASNRRRFPDQPDRQLG